MKLSEAALLCEGTSRAFTEVYKLYNFKDEDDLRAYCDFVIHEPVEWMRGFPVAWKSTTMFSKPRAAFHRLMKLSSVVDILGAEYCENVHEVVWNSFKAHMATILEKRAGRQGVAVTTTQDSDTESEKSGSAESDMLTADSFDSESVLEQVPPVPEPPKNSLSWFGSGGATGGKTGALDYKQKYEVTLRVLRTLLGTGGFQGLDEASRLRAALNLLLSEYERA
jgi:hypothetical protein